MGRRRVWLGVLVGVALLAGLILVGRQWKPTPNFAFLDNRRPIFSVDPGLGGFVGKAYTWQGAYKRLVEEADRELKVLKMDRFDTKNGRGVSFTRPIGHPLGSVSIYISPKRITGKHFHIDGDYVDTSDEAGWISVEVSSEDPMPMWLRGFLNGL